MVWVKTELKGHVEFLIEQHQQVLLRAPNSSCAQAVSVLGIAPTPVQDLAFGLVVCLFVFLAMLLTVASYSQAGQLLS